MTAIRCAVELRDGGETSPGQLVGVLMRYGSPGVHGREVFAPGALRWPANGIRIDLDHASSPSRGSVQPPIMRAVPFLSADGAEVRIDAPLPDTQAARDLAVLMRADPPCYAGMSVEFNALRSGYAGGRRVIQDALLKGAGLTSDGPSYADTSIEVRHRRDAPPMRGGLLLPTGRAVWL